METGEPDAEPTAEHALPELRPEAPQRPEPTGAGFPLEIRVFRPTFAALPGQVHEVAIGDVAGATAVRARWRSEYAFLHLGTGDDLDVLLAACDQLSELWVEEATEQYREWLVDALFVTQSALIELLEAD